MGNFYTPNDKAYQFIRSTDCLYPLGNQAKDIKPLLTNPKHMVLESVHPSPFSARLGFFGSKPFSKANHYLTMHHVNPVDWHIK
nr:hypothetical protein QOL21_06965 [Acholeplasma laidlawii]